MNIPITHICKAKLPSKRFELSPYSGDCLEDIGIPGHGYAVFDRNSDFYIGDIVMCTKPNGNLQAYMKKVFSVDAESVTVGTCYKDPSKDFFFTAGEILGTLLYALDDDGNLVYSRNPVTLGVAK